MEGNNLSRASVNIGSYEDTDNCPSFEGTITINRDEAKKCAKMIQGMGFEKGWSEWTPIVCFHAV